MEEQKKEQKKHEQVLVTLPPQSKFLPVSINLKKGVGQEELSAVFKEILSSPAFKQGGFSDEEGKTADNLRLNCSVLLKPEFEVPQKFNDELPSYVIEVVKSIFERARNLDPIPRVSGGLGDMRDCDALVEARVGDKKQFTKFFGCTYLFKGFPVKEKVEGMGLGKAMISAIPREIVMRSLLLKAALAMLFLISRKRFLKYLRIYSSILQRNFVSLTKDEEPTSKDAHPPACASFHADFNKGATWGNNSFEVELKRAMNVVLEWETTRITQNIKAKDLLMENYWVNYDKRLQFYFLVANLAEFIYFFLANDTAYRFRAQDLFEELDQGKAYENPRKEVNRLFDILIQREHKRLGASQIKKYKTAKVLINLLFIFNKRFQRLMREFLVEVDRSKVILDENDWYFCLRREQYNFRGKSIEDRLAEVKKIDKEKNHVAIQLLFLKDANTDKNVPALKVIIP